ncbi:Cpap3-b [Cordylochernes scorpioides]|uniref:Cpap3-b n=1 Tax=Cordylochernes scorpioides TaxID=51811 RepID=A0ABY6KPD1_9ARAC|nr:Cpap3-b [Cordylochernes scorpioides]
MSLCPDCTASKYSRPLSPESGLCPRPDGMFPDPKDCSSFYSCHQGKPYRLQCPTGLSFNPARREIEEAVVFPSNRDDILEYLSPEQSSALKEFLDKAIAHVRDKDSDLGKMLSDFRAECDIERNDTQWDSSDTDNVRLFYKNIRLSRDKPSLAIIESTAAPKKETQKKTALPIQFFTSMQPLQTSQETNLIGQVKDIFEQMNAESFLSPLYKEICRFEVVVLYPHVREVFSKILSKENKNILCEFLNMVVKHVGTKTPL